MSTHFEKIVLEAITQINPDTWENYFARHFKKSETEFYEADEFFKGCLNIVEAIEKQITDRYKKRKSDLKTMFDKANNKTLIYENLEGTTYEQKRLETLYDVSMEISSMTENDFPVYLGNAPAGGYYSFNHLQRAKEAIIKAHNAETNGDLINSLSKTTPIKSEISEDQPLNEKYSKEDLKQYFEKYNIDKGWKYFFLKEADYNKFIRLLHLMVNGYDFDEPAELIKLQQGCKQGFRKVLQEIHREILIYPLQGDEKFYKVCRSIKDYKYKNLYHYLSH